MSAGPFILEIDDDGGAPSINALTPASVIVVRSGDDLRTKLEMYADPVRNQIVKNTPKARRWYVEKVLPALRYYCGKYDVSQPEWLVGNNHWETMSEEEQRRLFGPGELRFREFQPVNCPDIQVVREEEQQ